MTDPEEPTRWDDAALAAALFAVDPFGTGGVALRSLSGPVRDRWLTLVREYLPAGAPYRKLPIHITDGRLLGGLDLAATLRSGRPVAERGILAEADGGVVVIATAERIGAGMAARIGAALDCGEVFVERDGIALRMQTRIGVVALDEAMADDESPPRRCSTGWPSTSISPPFAWSRRPARRSPRPSSPGRGRGWPASPPMRTSSRRSAAPR